MNAAHTASPWATAPPPAPGAVRRPRLHARLTEACRAAPLVSIVAGAGFGKTTALTSWANDPACDAAVTWIDVGSADAAPGGLVEVLRQVLGHEGRSDPSDGPPPTVTDHRRRILVLDNLERIRSSRTFAALDPLLAQAPPDVTFVLASRWEPLLALSRRRAQDQVAEIGAEEFLMRPEEIRLVFEAGGVAVTDEQVCHLVEVTRCWPVAVRLACVAARSGSGPGGLETADGRVEQFVWRYLADEVFERLPASWQDVLQRISILDQVHVDLAWKVSGSALAPTVIEEIAARTGLFVPVPGAPGWFRPHQLAQAYLRTGLQAGGTRAVTELHERAARWFIDRGDIASAIPHAVDAQDDATIRSAIERTALAALSCSDEHSIRCARAIAAAPPDVWPNGRPLVLAIAVLASADPPTALALLPTVDPTMLASTQDRRLWAIARCKVLRNQARYADARAALTATCWQGASPAELVLHDTEFALAAASDDDLAQPTRHTERALVLARRVGADRPLVHLHVALSALALARGEPRDARIHAHEALARGRHFGPELELELAESRVACTRAALDLGEPADDGHCCDPPASWSEPGAPVHLFVTATTAEVHRRWRAGERPRPLLEHLDRAVAGIDGPAIHPGVLFAASHLELRLAEASQDLPRVQRAVTRIPTGIAEAQVLRAEEQRIRRAHRPGRDELRPVIRGDLAPQCESTWLLVLALDGVLAHLDGTSDTASLQEAFALARQTGRRGPFIDLGRPMFETLVARRSALPSHDGLVEELIEELRHRVPTRLPEPLTQAEIRILGHLDSMATLQEIATGLSLSRNTVKTHAAAVYRKLGTSSRRDAVTRARHLGLL